MSFLNKNWVILNDNLELDLKTRLLNNRGIFLKEDMDVFFGDSEQLHDPFLLKDMQKAVDRILKAIENNEKIVIFGDYDVDGVSGTAVLVHSLRILNANVSYRLPHRVKDGYGLQSHFVEELAGLGVSLIITVDNGISCKTAIDLAKTFGIDVIITDHHSIPDNFPSSAYAIIHPKQADCDYPFKDLAGSGVAFKLASALFITLMPDQAEEIIESLLDLACLGTVADCTSLTFENRTIVKKGLNAMHNSAWRGLKLLKDSVAGDDPYNSDIIGFRICPRINAAGRMAHAYFALQLLLDEGGKAELLLKKLDGLNDARRQVTEDAMQVLELMIEADIEMQSSVIAHDSGFPAGILGLLAGKISEKYGKPAFIMEDRGDVLIGSARCPEYFNVLDAINSASEYLDHYGGHKQAAGFSLKKENLSGFKEAIHLFSKNILLGDADLPPIQKGSLNIDTEISFDELSFDLCELIESFAPFGTGNPKPIFILKNLDLANIKTMGKDNAHLSFDVMSSGKKHRAVAFNFGEYVKQISSQSNVDIVCHLDINNWNGKQNLQIKVLDIGSK